MQKFLNCKSIEEWPIPFDEDKFFFISSFQPSMSAAVTRRQLVCCRRYPVVAASRRDGNIRASGRGMLALAADGRSLHSCHGPRQLWRGAGGFGQGFKKAIRAGGAACLPGFYSDEGQCWPGQSRARARGNIQMRSEGGDEKRSGAQFDLPGEGSREDAVQQTMRRLADNAFR